MGSFSSVIHLAGNTKKERADGPIPQPRHRIHRAGHVSGHRTCRPTGAAGQPDRRFVARTDGKRRPVGVAERDDLCEPERLGRSVGFAVRLTIGQPGRVAARVGRTIRLAVALARRCREPCRQPQPEEPWCRRLAGGAVVDASGLQESRPVRVLRRQAEPRARQEQPEPLSVREREPRSGESGCIALAKPLGEPFGKQLTASTAHPRQERQTDRSPR